MAYPLFLPDTLYIAGARVTVPTGEVYEKVKTGRVTAAPKVGTTWKKVEIEVAPSEGAITWRTLAGFRTSTSALLGAPYFLNEPSKRGTFYYVGRTDKEDDGARTLKGPGGRTYERHIDHGLILTSWYDVIPGRPDLATQNALNLDRAIKANNYCTLRAPKPSDAPCTYYINHVPGSGIFYADQEEACISFCDKVMVFEFDLGVTAEVEAGYTAQQAFERYSRGYVVSKRVAYSHKGGPGKEHGAIRNEKGELQVNEKGELVYSQDWGNAYKIHGFKQWCAGELHGVSAYGFPGHGLSVFGQKGVRAIPVYQEFAGRVEYWNGDMLLYPDKDSDMQTLSFNGCMVEIEGQPRRYVAQATPVGGTSLSYGSPESTGIPAGTKVRGRYARQTRDFFADFVQSYPLDGLNNFDNNGGCGVHVVGAEANHGLFHAISCRDNGAWTIADNSFLGCHWLGVHATTNGKRFGYSIGGVTTGYNPNTGASFLYNYREEGMGPDLLYGNATIAFGFSRNGVAGGGSVILNNRLQGFAQLENLGRTEGKANLTLSRMARAVDEITPTPTLAEARAAYVAQNLMALPLAA